MNERTLTLPGIEFTMHKTGELSVWDQDELPQEVATLGPAEILALLALIRGPVKSDA
jgi:hypothetical protein